MSNNLTGKLGLLTSHFDERDCGCIVRGDGMWVRMCQQHGQIHRQQLFVRSPGMLSDGSVKKHRGHGHTKKTHGSEPRRLANHYAREAALGNMKSKR